MGLSERTLLLFGRLLDTVGDEAFERDFLAQSRKVAMDHGDGRLPAGARVTDLTVTRFEIAVDVHWIERRELAYITQAKIVLVGPQERRCVKAFTPPEHVVRDALALALGHHPVLDRTLSPVRRSGQRAMSPAA